MIIIMVMTLPGLTHTVIAIGMIMPTAIITTIIMRTAMTTIMNTVMTMTTFTVRSTMTRMPEPTPQRSNGDLRPARRTICRPFCSA